ncbi:hypothetical protein K1X12_03380 [Hyphomonas sp. WL0036]|uniref:NtrZ family periplasmic regulatory protein n=1 Tax=Hyphomonas sediminis TaxID=2866160 RepID=UPI001C7E571B|nr:hypothetical protein [Hyphomonas sediminis]MBY9065922.1 hypothetical protein [Hyphomonas sediminis]
MRADLVLSFALAAAAFTLPAVAQERLADDVIRVEAPTLSETSSARTDWYRQFSEGKPPESRLQWQAEPTQEFSVHIGKDSRWQLNLDKVTRPGETMLPREEVQAGATFRVTPRFSVGGEVRFGADEIDSSTRWESQEVEAGIRLKSAFKF